MSGFPLHKRERGVMYFDAVLDEQLKPIFNGSPEEVRAWLQSNPVAPGHCVCVGQTMRLVPVHEFLSR